MQMDSADSMYAVTITTFIKFCRKIVSQRCKAIQCDCSLLHLLHSSCQAQFVCYGAHPFIGFQRLSLWMVYSGNLSWESVLVDFVCLSVFTCNLSCRQHIFKTNLTSPFFILSVFVHIFVARRIHFTSWI